MEKEQIESEWQSIKIGITHTPNKFGNISHIELKANKQFPDTEAGYSFYDHLHLFVGVMLLD